MKKILLSLIGILCSMSMWAGVTDLSFTATKKIAAGGEIWWTTAANVAAANTAGWCSNNAQGSNNKKGNITPKLSEDEVGEAASYSMDGVQVKATNTPGDLTTSKKAIVFKVTNTTEFTVYGGTTSSSLATSVWLSVYKADGTEVDVNNVGVGAATNMTCTATVSGLDENETYVVNIIGGLKATAGETPAINAGGQDMVVYAIKFAAPASGKQASSFALTSANELLLAPSETSQITTTGNAGTISYTSGAPAIATVSNSGLITAVGGGITTITVSDPGTSEVDGRDLSVTVKSLYPEDKISSTFKFDNAGYFLTNNNNWYFKNGWSIATDQGFQYAALECNGKTNNGFKANANKTYTINVPAGVTIRSAKVTMRNNYKSTDKDVKAANWGTIFGQDLSSETLPYSNETADTKEFDITNETPMTFTPGGNQCQMYIELSTEALKQNNDLALSSNTANVEKNRTTTVTFTSSSTGTVTATSSKTSVATVAVNGNNIEITGVAGGTATITVAQAADATYKAGEQTITVTVTDPTAPTVVFDALNSVGTATGFGTATVAPSGMFTFSNGIDPNGTGAPVNYVKIMPAAGGFKAGDVIDFTAYINNSNTTKVGYLAIVAPNDQELTIIHTSEQLKNLNSAGSNYASQAEPQQYTLTSDYESLYIARAASGNTGTNVSALTVSRPATVATPSINAYGYGTFSCEYDVQITGAKAYKATINGAGDALVCEEIANGLVPAGEGVLLFKSGTTEATTATALYVDNAPAVSNNELKATTLADGSLADLESALVLSGNTFVRFNGATFAAGKAYLPYVASAKSFRIVFPQDGQTTGINTISAQKVANAKFIENGRIVIVKDGAKYNVAGQVIK